MKSLIKWVYKRNKALVFLLIALLFTEYATVENKQIEKSDFYRLVQECESAKTSDEKYEAFKSYLITHRLPVGFLEEKTRFDKGDLDMQVIGNIGVVCQLGGYRCPPGFVVFIDIGKDEIILLDTEYDLGNLSVKTIPCPEQYGVPEAISPQTLVIVKYLSGSGTGYLLYSEKIYTIDRGSVQLSFDEPCYEVDAGLANRVATFERRNSYVPRKGLYEIYIAGIAKREPEGAPVVVYQLPMEVYAWNPLTKQFDQVAGRKHPRGRCLYNIYADLVFLDEHGIEEVPVLNGSDRRGVPLEKEAAPSP